MKRLSMEKSGWSFQRAARGGKEQAVINCFTGSIRAPAKRSNKSEKKEEHVEILDHGAAE